MRQQSVTPIAIIAAAVVALSACRSGESTPPTPTAVAIVRPLATVAPTVTLERSALPPTLTPTVTPVPSPTPYIGVFRGEGQPLESFTGFEPPAEQVGVPLSSGIPLICTITPDPLFGVQWGSELRAFNGLRCPIQIAFQVNVRMQIFERGVMYWREDTLEVWAIHPGGLTETGEHWSISQLPVIATTALTGIQVPPGLRLPEGVLATVWAGLPQVRETLGFALTQEQQIQANIQRFEGGALFRDASVGQVFALLVNGDAFGPFDDAG